MVDAGAVAAFGAGAALHSSAGSTSTAFYVTGFFGYWLGPAVVHTVHGHFKKAAASAGLRFVAPLLGLGAGAAFSACSDRRRCDEAPIWLGLVTGVVAGSVLDAAALAYDEKPTPKASLGRVMPMLAPLPHGLQIGLVGTLDAE